MVHSKKLRYLYFLICLVYSTLLLSCAKITQLTGSPLHTDPDMQTVLNLSTSIQSVSTGGLWAYGEQSGWLRFVIIGGGVEHYRTYLYLQWFSQTDDTLDIKQIKTVSVTELNGIYTEPAVPTRYTFAIPKCKKKIACTEATIEAYDFLKGTNKQFTLFLDNEPGNYRLEAK